MKSSPSPTGSGSVLYKFIQEKQTNKKQETFSFGEDKKFYTEDIIAFESLESSTNDILKIDKDSIQLVGEMPLPSQPDNETINEFDRKACQQPNYFTDLYRISSLKNLCERVGKKEE